MLIIFDMNELTMPQLCRHSFCRHIPQATSILHVCLANHVSSYMNTVPIHCPFLEVPIKIKDRGCIVAKTALYLREQSS